MSGDFQTVAYDAQSGKPITPTTVTTTLSSGTFNGFQIVVPQGDLIQLKAVQSYNGYGQSEVGEVEIKTEGWYRVSEKTTEGELPDTVIIWRVGDETEKELDRVAPSQVIPVYLTPGVYHLRFIWPYLQPPASSIPMPTDGGGPKG